METGRSRPSGQMIMRLADALDVPSGDRNEMLSSAGFEPIYEPQKIDRNDQVAFNRAFQHMLTAQEPYPALVLNRWFDVIDMNRSAKRFFLKSEDHEPANIIAKF